MRAPSPGAPRPKCRAIFFSSIRSGVHGTGLDPESSGSKEKVDGVGERTAVPRLVVLSVRPAFRGNSLPVGEYGSLGTGDAVLDLRDIGGTDS